MEGRLPHGLCTTGKRKHIAEMPHQPLKNFRLVNFSFLSPPMIEKPPDWPLPDPSKNTRWYGEIWLKYPLGGDLSPSFFGQLIKARSQFRVIMNEFCHEAYSKGSKLTLYKANELHARLECWFDHLPEPLRPKAIVLPSHLQLQYVPNPLESILGSATHACSECVTVCLDC